MIPGFSRVESSRSIGQIPTLISFTGSLGITTERPFYIASFDKVRCLAGLIVQVNAALSTTFASASIRQNAVGKRGYILF